MLDEYYNRNREALEDLESAVKDDGYFKGPHFITKEIYSLEEGLHVPSGRISLPIISISFLGEREDNNAPNLINSYTIFNDVFFQETPGKVQSILESYEDFFAEHPKTICLETRGEGIIDTVKNHFTDYFSMRKELLNENTMNRFNNQKYDRSSINLFLSCFQEY